MFDYSTVVDTDYTFYIVDSVINSLTSVAASIVTGDGSCWYLLFVIVSDSQSSQVAPFLARLLQQVVALAVK